MENQVDFSNPPIATKITKATEIHGYTLIDDYAWFREKDNPSVIEYLNAENEYSQNKTMHLNEPIDAIFEEMKSRIKETDSTVPAKRGKYYYYSRTVKDLQYPIHCRKLGMGGQEEILLDINESAKGFDFYKVSRIAISPNQKLLAYAFDIEGYEKYTIVIKNLDTGEILPDSIIDVSSDMEWASDTILYYVVNKEITHRAYMVRRHILEETIDEEIFVEDDEERYIGLFKSHDKQFLFLQTNTRSSSEVWFLYLNQPLDTFTCFRKRQADYEYDLEHHGDNFLITTNADGSTNFKVMITSAESYDDVHWLELFPYDDKVRIEEVIPFKSFYGIHKRENGVPSFLIFFPNDRSNNHEIDFPEPNYDVFSYTNHEYDVSNLRMMYSSLITPWTVYDYNIHDRNLSRLKENEVKGYDRDNYRMERQFVRADDGSKVPVTFAYRKDLSFPAPTYLTGYGSYGFAEDVIFRSSFVSLLDRGMVVALAHVRGGSDLGKQWYDDGKLLKKKNTFTDFINIAEHLIANGTTTTSQLAVEGASAGGLLMGAVVNMRPDLFHLVVAEVPFVDVINTMLDSSIPLTTFEYTEWGNPNDLEYFDYMRSYSPYDNIEAKDYPHILVTAGLNDPRVHFWEPTKWVAKLRDVKTDTKDLIYKINMGAGHSGASGRYDRLKELAFIYAVVFDKLNCLVRIDT